jgi:hypothetical protein
MYVNSVDVNKSHHVGTAHITGRSKVELTYPTVDSITRMIWASKDEL